MKVLSLPYVAGIIDGEGTITFQHLRSQRWQIVLRVHVAQTFFPLIKALHKQFGGCLHRVHARRRKAKDQLSWQLGGQAAATLLRRLKPWIFQKRGQAALAEKWSKMPRRKKGNYVVTSKDKRYRLSLLRQMRKLNKRGRS